MTEPSHEAVLQFVQQHSCPFVTTEDVAERFPSVHDRTLRKRLNDLVEADELEWRQIGAHAKVWYIPDQRNALANSSSPSSVSQ